MKPAIVVSGHTMGLGVVRALAEKGIPVRLIHHDQRDMAQASRYVEQSLRAPHPEKDEERFIELLMEAPLGRGVLIPTSDEAVAALSRHKSRLERVYTVACNDWVVTRQFIDKNLTYELAAASGVAAPRTVRPLHRDDVRSYARTCDFPCLVKPCQSHLYYDRFGRKMTQVETPAHMMEAYEEAALAGLKVVLQEWVPGGDGNVVNYNAYFHEGKPLAEFTAAHVRNAPPRFGSPRVAVSRVIDEVVEPGRKILSAMGFNGYACTEFKQDPRDGVFKLMEVNGRHNLSTLLAVRCGINFPWMHYAHLAQGLLPEQPPWRENVYWVDSLRDIAYSLAYWREENYRWADYLAPYLQEKTYAILDRHDLGPYLRRLWNLAVSAPSGFFKSMKKGDGSFPIVKDKGQP